MSCNYKRQRQTRNREIILIRKTVYFNHVLQNMITEEINKGEIYLCICNNMIMRR